MTVQPYRHTWLLGFLLLALAGCEEALESPAPVPVAPPDSSEDPDFVYLRGVPTLPQLETHTWTGEGWVPRAEEPDGWPNGVTPMSGRTGRCPEGQVPLARFRSPDEGLDEYTQVQTQGAVEAPELALRAIEIISNACGGNPSAPNLQAVREACNGRERCNYIAECASNYQVSYRCAAGTAEPEAARTVTVGRPAANAPAVLSCAPTAETVEPTEETTCVPKVCRGRTRRNADMQCVPDLTMPILYAASTNAPYAVHMWTRTDPLSPGGVDAEHWEHRRRWWDQNTMVPPQFYRKYGPETTEYYFGNGPYTFRYFAPPNLPLPATAGTRSNAAAMEQIEGVRAVLWFSDIWSFHDGTTVETFRCVGRTFETAFESPGLLTWNAIRMPFNESCFSEETIDTSRAEAIARKAWPASSPAPRLLDGMAHMSFDLEGRMLFVPEPFDEGAACAPNPPEFYYDPQTRRYDMLSYYRQRLWTTFLNPITNEHPRRFQLTSAPTLTFGIETVQIRDPEVTVYQQERFPATVTVDLTWYALFESRANPASTQAWLTNNGVTPGRLATSLRAMFYLYEAEELPTDPTENLPHHGPLLGTARLGSATPEGTTVSTRLTIPTETKARLFDPQRRFFTPPNVQQRQYWVLACLESTNPANPLASYFKPPNVPINSGVFFVGSQVPGLGTVASTILGTSRSTTFYPFGPWTPWHPSLDPAMTFALDSIGRRVPPGCTWAETPLTIVADPYERHLDPVFSTGWSGLAQQDESGDASTNGQLDGDMGRVCEELPDRPRVCRSEMAQGGAGGGTEFRQSYHNLSFSVTVNESGVAQAGGLGEIFGFQLFDSLGVEINPEDAWEEGEQPSLPVTFDAEFDFEEGFAELTIYPPFKAAATRLNTGRSPEDRIRWTGDDRTGLALAYVYKKPVKIGPIPGEATFTLSVGVRLNTSIRYTWKPPTTYPCEGRTEPCYVVSAASDRRTHTEAQATCLAHGGRLAELSSQEEADAVFAAVDAVGTGSAPQYWLGGQAAYRFERPECRNWFVAGCLNARHTVLRWLFEDRLMQDEDGSLRPETLFSASAPVLTQPPPTALGFVVRYPDPGPDRVASMRAVRSSTPLPYICRYEPVLEAEFREVRFAIATGVFAGFAIGFCSPSSKGGVCVGGSVRFVDVETTPSFALSDWTFYEGVEGASDVRRRVQQNTTATIKVDFGVTLLAVGITATIKLWVFSRTWDIFKFPGFKVADMTLYEFSVPSSERR